MVAVLKPLAARCLERPQYDNTRIGKPSQWVTDNEPTLRAYYAALGKSLGEDDGLLGYARAQAYCAWCQGQRDIELFRGLH